MTVVFVAMFGHDLSLLPEGVKMSVAIQFLMLSIGAIILLVTKVEQKNCPLQRLYRWYDGCGDNFWYHWMSDTIISFHKPYLISLVSEIVAAHPWTFAIAMFVVSIFLKSQAGTHHNAALFRVFDGHSDSCPHWCITRMLCVFLLPFYPSDLAAITLDRSGTTRIGKYVLNHSFLLPGFIGVSTATTVAIFSQPWL